MTLLSGCGTSSPSVSQVRYIFGIGLGVFGRCPVQSRNRSARLGKSVVTAQ